MSRWHQGETSPMSGQPAAALQWQSLDISMTMNTDIKVCSGRLERMIMTLLESTICNKDMKKKGAARAVASEGKGLRAHLAVGVVDCERRVHGLKVHRTIYAMTDVVQRFMYDN